MKMKRYAFKFVLFSIKQLQILTWWCESSPVKNKGGIIADGSIRAGKTLPMSMSFVFWAMSTFDGQVFAMCGKTIGSFRRNVLFILIPLLRIRKYKVRYHRTDNLLTIQRGKVVNYFYIFGGKDERSQDLIQGMTLAGILFDEAGIMPESFINQATARCSVDGSKLWFNTNPSGGPHHYFKENWIDRVDDLDLLYIHLVLDDNPSLSEEKKASYRKGYQGVFHKRFILGLWVAAEGAIYCAFVDNEEAFIWDELPEGKHIQYARIGIDFGESKSAYAANCTGYTDGFKEVVTLDEFYSKTQFTPQQLYTALIKFIKLQIAQYTILEIRCDTAQQTLMRGLANALLKAGVNIPVKGALKLEIVDRIDFYTILMGLGRYRILRKCPHTINAFSEAVWNAKVENKRLDDGSTNIDSLDAQEYSTEPDQKKILKIIQWSD